MRTIFLILLCVSFSWSQGTYTTTFSGTENPISENGNWINSFTNKWAKIRTNGSIAYGTQVGNGTYDDAVAFLVGTNYGPNQTSTGVLYSVNQSSNGYYEIEFLFRATWTTDSLKLYEVNWRMLNTSSSYMEVVKWTGKYNDVNAFVYLGRLTGTSAGVNNGDTLKASCTTENGVVTLKAWTNGVLKISCTDTTASPYLSGQPGIGHWRNGPATNSDWGWDYAYIQTSGPVSIDEQMGLPRVFRLHQNYPNPFNPSTRITYELPKPTAVSLEIFDMMGKKVRTLVDTFQQAGHYSVLWDGRNYAIQNVGSGIYICRLHAGNELQAKKMLLLQ